MLKVYETESNSTDEFKQKLETCLTVTQSNFHEEAQVLYICFLKMHVRNEK